MKQTYIIEHLEPKLWKWAFEEYKNISKIVGKKNLWFTNIKNKSDSKKLAKIGKTFSKSIKEINPEKACILDATAKKLLEPKESKKFKYFIFGGILGDYPPKKRTKKELTPFLKAKSRNIEKKQMSTDNAVYTVHQISKGIPISKLKFKNNVEIKKGKYESFILPFRYNLVNGKPMMSKWVLNHLKRKKGF